MISYIKQGHNNDINNKNNMNNNNNNNGSIKEYKLSFFLPQLNQRLYQILSLCSNAEIIK